jgi:plasmid stability protein
MPAVAVRNLPEQTLRALKHRAAQHGVSTEAEIRAILEQAVLPEGRLKLGSALAALGKKYGGVDLSIIRDPSPTEPAEFE